MRRRPLIYLGILLAAIVGTGIAAILPRGEDDAGDSAPASGRTTPKGTATVWAVGDGADGGGDALRVADVIERGRPDRLLYLGDVYDAGTRDEFENRYKPVYGRFDKIGAPTPGNHDWPNHEAGYDPYWDAANPEVPTDRHFYRFKIGGWEVLSLNSESGLDSGSPQMRWLTQRMRDASGTCRIAFWHRPFLNAGKHGDQESVAPLWRAVRGRAALVITGHDHNMQHFKRRDGIVELVSGAGGHDLYSSNENDPRLVWDEDDEFGALRLDLRRGLARFRFVDDAGKTLHRGRVRCRG